MTTSRRDLPAITIESRVEWMDTDAAGIYHNSAILRFVEAAEAALMRRLQIDGYFPVAPRVRIEVVFKASLYFEQRVSTLLRVAHVGTSSLRFEFDVLGEPFAGRPRQAAAHGSYTTVHLAGRLGTSARSSPWPARWRERLLADSEVAR